MILIHVNGSRYDLDPFTILSLNYDINNINDKIYSKNLNILKNKLNEYLQKNFGIIYSKSEKFFKVFTNEFLILKNSLDKNTFKEQFKEILQKSFTTDIEFKSSTITKKTTWINSCNNIYDNIILNLSSTDIEKIKQYKENLNNKYQNVKDFYNKISNNDCNPLIINNNSFGNDKLLPEFPLHTIDILYHEQLGNTGSVGGQGEFFLTLILPGCSKNKNGGDITINIENGKSGEVKNLTNQSGASLAGQNDQTKSYASLVGNKKFVQFFINTFFISYSNIKAKLVSTFELDGLSLKPGIIKNTEFDKIEDPNNNFIIEDNKYNFIKSVRGYGFIEIVKLYYNSLINLYEQLNQLETKLKQLDLKSDDSNMDNSNILNDYRTNNKWLENFYKIKNKINNIININNEDNLLKDLIKQALYNGFINKYNSSIQAYLADCTINLKDISKNLANTFFNGTELKENFLSEDLKIWNNYFGVIELKLYLVIEKISYFIPEYYKNNIYIYIFNADSLKNATYEKIIDSFNNVGIYFIMPEFNTDNQRRNSRITIDPSI